MSVVARAADRNWYGETTIAEGNTFILASLSRARVAGNNRL
jgi:hypothetical protein